MIQHNKSSTRTRQQPAGRRLTHAAMVIGCASFTALLVWSGVTAFQRDTAPTPLAAKPAAADTTRHARRNALGERPAPKAPALEAPAVDVEVVGQHTPVIVSPEPAPRVMPVREAEQPKAPTVKRDREGKVIMVNGKPWTGETFDYKPIRPVQTRTMKTTAYSPDERSCGKWADGITASGKSVWMNGGRLLAADRAIPYGTIMTVPGYNNGKPVQVWDRGGAIKGNRLDLLYPTHDTAKQWGVQDLPVVFWEYVDVD